jgi:hypothetical protein
MTTSPKSMPISRAEKTSWAMNDVMRPEYMVTMISEVDATAIAAIRDRYKQAGLTVPSYTALVIKMAALMMKRIPEANRAILGFPLLKKLYQFENIDISVAVEKSLPFLPGQALAETIHSTLDKPLIVISDELKKFASDTVDTNERWRTFSRILAYVPRPVSNILINLPYQFPSLWKQHRGCACWVNAPSKAGGDLVFTTWPWPITFSFGKVKKRPTVAGDEVVARLTMPLVMVFDRRIMGGGPASRLFAQAVEVLEDPVKYLLTSAERRDLSIED